ncbi:MAG: SGNH/GDSL hydrolase family protein [Kiritimatiellia bacterium]
MKHLKTAAVLILALALTATAAGKCGGCALKNDTNSKDFFIRDNDRVVFLGDSITQQKLYTTYIEVYTLTRFPEYTLSFRNTGWGGDTAWLRKRFSTDEKALFAATGEILDKLVVEAVHTGLQRDVLPLQPTAVTIKFGMNDVHCKAPGPDDVLRAHKRSQEELVRTLKKSGARVALLTSQPIEDMKKNPQEDERNLSLRQFSDVLKEIAVAEGAEYVDQFDPYMNVISRREEAQTKAFGEGDAVHPGPCGHTVMAWTILKQLHAPALVSSAAIDLSARWYNFRKKVAAENCAISNVSYQNKTLSFDRLDAALPMPVDKRALNALKLAPITCDLNCYPLYMKGLADGEYELLIDGKTITTLTSAKGKVCANLAEFATPATAQADKLLGLVFEKNEVYFNRWRNVQLKNPADPKLAELDKQIADFETQINALRKPVVHHFEIKPL